MRILSVAYYFPPYNTVGAIRAGRFAAYLAQNGHDIHVLSAKGLRLGQDLRCDIAADRVHRAGAIDVVAPARFAASMRARLRATLDRARPPGGGCTAPQSTANSAAGRSVPAGGSLLRTLAMLYRRVVGFPDAKIGWFPPAVACGSSLLGAWRPEIIFATAPPFTTLMVARRLSRKFGIPWVAEYRDRFFEDPYGPPTGLRKTIEKRFEDRLLDGASGIVTVSGPWAEDYRARFGLPVAAVYNGFDPEDFPADYPRGRSDRDVLRIVYTGILYHERRDPSPLFEAISLLGEAGKSVRVEFYGADEAVLTGMARKYGVGDHVAVRGRVPYDQSIALQMQADVLLLLQWNDARESGNVPSKLFEYLGSRRPVLGIGYEKGVPAGILEQREAGVVLNDPAAIAERLTRWLEIKRAAGAIPLLPVTVRDGLSRAEQYDGLEEFLAQRIAASGE